MAGPSTLGSACGGLQCAQPERRKEKPQPQQVLLPAITAVLNAAFSIVQYHRNILVAEAFKGPLFKLITK